MEFILPDTAMSSLVLNREHSKRQAEAQKIIKSHFSGSDINIQPFIDMEWKVLPRDIAWMVMNASSRNSVNGFSLLYQFVRNLPSFFEIGDDYLRSAPKDKRQNVM